VREQAVEADRDPQGCQDVHAQQQPQINPTKAAAPEEHGDAEQSQEWHNHHHKARHSHAR